MSRYEFEIAPPAADAALRNILAATPIPGNIAVSFRREPSYFQAAVVEGTFRQVVIARDAQLGQIVGFGSRSIGSRYVNGTPQPVGYLSSLRLLPEHRKRGLIARGYRYLRQLHGDGRACMYLTTIAAGNRVAIETLTSGRAGLPVYHPLGNYETLAIPLGRPPSNGHDSANLDIRPAISGDLPSIIAFLHVHGPQRQFFPYYVEGDFFAVDTAFRDLQPEDLLLAFRGGQLVGTLAGWDQFPFRQTVVHRYERRLRCMRLPYNGWARWRGLPQLPAPGEPLRCLVAALPVVADDNATVFADLLTTLLARTANGPATHLVLGLHERDRLLPVARRYATIRYRTHVYVACWEDGEAVRSGLDGRVPYLELGSL